MNDQCNAERHLSSNEVAKRLQCSTRTINRLRSRGEFPNPIRIGNLIRWRLKDLIAYEESLVQSYNHK